MICSATYQLKSLLHHHCRLQENQQLLKPRFKCRKALISSNYINFTLILKHKKTIKHTHTHTHTQIAFKVQFNDKNTEKQALTNIELDKQNI